MTAGVATGSALPYHRRMRSAVTMAARAATPGDAPALARIYNEGIEDRIATFETRRREPGEIRGWIGGSHPLVVVEAGEQVVAWASCSAYSARECYRGVAEVSVYVAREWRGRGAGRKALEALGAAAGAAGFHKLVGKIFAGNRASLALVRALGFREVGVHVRHGELDGVWHDIVVVERLLDGPAGGRATR